VTLAGRKILYLVSEDWYFVSHRLALGRAARDAGAEVVVATRVRDHGDAIEAAGLRLAPIEIDRSGINPWRDVATIREITALYRRERPDIVHHVALKPILYGGVAAWRAKVPRVVNAVAGMGFMFISSGVLARALRPFILAAQRWLMNRPQSRTILQNPDDVALYTRRVGVDPDHVVAIPGAGVDIETFRPSPEPTALRDPPVALCVSRMLRDKGLYELVAAAELLRDRGIALRIRLVGPSDDNPAAIPAETLETWRRDGIVDVAGASNDIAGEYARADIAVLPSYREGLPKSLLEAAAAGLPMVATDVPGCREVCRDGETGRLVPARLVEPLADALAELANDPAKRKRFGDNARALAESTFADTRINHAILELYIKMGATHT